MTAKILIELSPVLVEKLIEIAQRPEIASITLEVNPPNFVGSFTEVKVTRLEETPILGVCGHKPDRRCRRCIAQLRCKIAAG